MEVSKGTAVFFKDQIIGGHNGHMAEIPNNPTLQGLTIAHGVYNSTSDFCAFLRAVADQLDGGEKPQS